MTKTKVETLPVTREAMRTDIVEVVKGLPPEAIVEVVGTIRDYARSRHIFAAREQEFQYILARIESKNLDKKHRMKELTALLESDLLTAADRSQIVEAICSVATKFDD